MAKPKPKDPYARISLRLSQGAKENIDKLAKMRGVSTNSLIVQALSLYLGLPADLLESFKKHAEDFQLPVETIIAHILAKRFAYDKAWLDVFGQNPPGVFREFRFDDQGLVTGDKLLFELYEDFKKILSDLKEKVEKSEKTRKKVLVYKEELSTLYAGA